MRRDPLRTTSTEEDSTMAAKRRSQWLKGIVAVGLGLTLLGLGAGGAYGDPRRLPHGTAAPDACDIEGARLGVPGTVVTDLLDRGGFVACLHKATNREALECVAATAARLAGGSDRIDPTGAPIWLVPKEKPQPWWCVGALGQCTCEGNDDCVDLILFGPCDGGTMVCDKNDEVCSCYF